MMRGPRGGVALAAALILLGLAAEAATPILPLSEVKPGMTGRGRSVFRGAAVEEFEVEVLGVLHNVEPKRSLILARLRGQGLEQTGLISGMSGSPVYVDGKLIGAVSSGYAFAKEAIAGITPIEEMLAVTRAPSPSKKGMLASPAFAEDLSQEELGTRFLAALAPPPVGRPAFPAARPLDVPLVLSGFTEGAFERARAFFSSAGLRAVKGGTIGQGIPGPSVPPAPAFKPGEAIGLQLVWGDLDISAVGTVTDVDGARVLAFGHPLYNLGAVDYGLTRAEVLGVMPSLESSFKLAAAGPVVGRFSEDRTAGVAGEVGVLPKPVPMNIVLQTGSGDRQEFKLKLASDRFLTPALINLAVSSLVTGRTRSYGDISLDFDADVYLDQRGLSVHLEDLFSGSLDNAPVNLSGLLAAVVHYLMNNEFQDVAIFRIDLNVRAVEQARLGVLERVLLDKYEAAPGEPIRISAHLRTRQGESLTEEATLIAPALPAGSEFQLVVGDAAAIQQLERAQYRVQEVVPRSLGQLVRILGNLRKNNRIYFRLLAAKPGLFLKGEEMPNLPPSLKTMFSSPRVSASSPTEISRSTLGEFQLAVPHVVRGLATIPVRIRR